MIRTKIFIIYDFLNHLRMSYENQGIDKPSSISNSNQQKKSTKAKRLTFSYENNNIKLIDEQRIDKIIPPSTPLTELENKRVNFLLEVSDDKNNTLYRQVIENQIKRDIEIFSNEPKESISRKELSEIKGVFSVVIPDQPEAESLDIFRSRDLTRKTRESILEDIDTNKIFHLNLKSKEASNNK
jgi:hypothetical protein